MANMVALVKIALITQLNLIMFDYFDFSEMHDGYNGHTRVQLGNFSFA